MIKSVFDLKMLITTLPNSASAGPYVNIETNSGLELVLTMIQLS